MGELVGMNIKIRELINYIEIFAKHRQCTNRHVKCIEKIINYEIHSHEYAAATQVQTNAVQMLGCVSRRFGEEHQLRNRFDSFVQSGDGGERRPGCNTP